MAAALDRPRRAARAAPRDACAHRRSIAGLAGGAAAGQSIRSSSTWFAAPHSYTGDDVVEISAHGSPVLLQRIVELAMHAGARLAEPGEFTLRAYLNGRIDLVQAEAVADLVDAVTPLQARAAMDQLEGTLTAAIGRIDARAVRSGGAARGVARFSRRGIPLRHARRHARGARRRFAGDLDALIRDGRARPRAPRGPARRASSGGRTPASRACSTRSPAPSRAIVTDVPGHDARRADRARRHRRRAGHARRHRGPARRARRDRGRRRRARRQARDVAALTWSSSIDRAHATEDDRRVLDEIARAARRRDQQMRSSTPPGCACLRQALGPRRRTAGPRTPNPGTVRCEVSATTAEGLDALRVAIVGALPNAKSSRDTPAISNVRHLELVERATAAVDAAVGAIDAGATEELDPRRSSAPRVQRSKRSRAGATPRICCVIFSSRFCIGK